MRTEHIQEITDFLMLLRDSHTFLHRGQPKHDDPLIPSVARGWADEPNPLLAIERSMLHDWRRRALPFLPFRPQSDWEWLMLGQHYGMPTRLLDWTTNPLVALYFACASHGQTDGAVFILSTYGCKIEELDYVAHPDPFTISVPVYLAPPHVTLRLAAQDGFFTASANPLQSLDAACAMKIVIDQKHKRRITHELAGYGVRPSSLFPDLTGLALDIAYTTRRCKDGYVYLRDSLRDQPSA